jgi:membrane associated rhomboid family serine protease
MSADASQAFPQAFALREGQGAIVLHASGIRHPRFPRFLGETFTPWEDVTHHAVSSRGLRLATRRSVYLFPRGAFVDPHAPDELARALIEQIGRQPGGREQLDRMWEAEKRAARPQPVRVAPALAALCVVVFALGLLPGSERLFIAGFFGDALVREGDWWRLATANFLHSGVAHLALNTLCLLGVGPLVERVLGPVRTVFVLGAAGLGGMAAGLLARYEMAVGASGIVFGLAGALLWLELRCAQRLPSGWRVPRGLLFAALIGDGVLSLVLPGIAAAAHAGGLAAGFAACALVASSALERKRPRLWLVAADGAVVFGLAAAFAAAVSLYFADGSLLAARAARLVDREGVGALTLNNYAWMIATDARATPEDLTVAVRLAERAVEETERRDPNILDTLAEAQFQAGDPAEAVRTIDEAIALAPHHDYFREQRRRFTGERDPEDRPESPPIWIEPELPTPDDELEPFEPEEEDGGFRV